MSASKVFLPLTRKGQRATRLWESSAGQPRRPHLAALLGVFFVLQAVLFASLSLAQMVTYTYDELGRLIAAVDPSGNAAQYNYDKVGNLLSITRTTAATASVFTVMPNNGPPGLNIVVYGDGFGATPSQNTAKFNGTPATIVSCSQTTMVVAVPSGATSGPVTVTTPVGSATSPASFTVTAN
jgi:YD repeat-containing protein